MTQRIIEIVKESVKETAKITKEAIEPEFYATKSTQSYFKAQLINAVSGKIRSLSAEEIRQLMEDFRAEVEL